MLHIFLFSDVKNLLSIILFKIDKKISMLCLVLSFLVLWMQICAFECFWRLLYLVGVMRIVKRMWLFSKNKKNKKQQKPTQQKSSKCKHIKKHDTFLLLSKGAKSVWVARTIFSRDFLIFSCAPCLWWMAILVNELLLNVFGAFFSRLLNYVSVMYVHLGML